MREICLARLDKTRPVVVLTRAAARSAMTKVTLAPITSTVKGLHSEVPVGAANGLDGEGVIRSTTSSPSRSSCWGAPSAISVSSRSASSHVPSCSPTTSTWRSPSSEQGMRHGHQACRLWVDNHPET